MNNQREGKQLKIVIQLPHDRDFAGTLSVVNDLGHVLAGPFPVCGRAAGRAAAAHGNPRRLATLPYGDTPLGAYRVRSVLKSGLGTAYRPEEFGPHGIVVLDAVSGEAALAEAAGRFHIFVQGGKPASNRRLRVTNGCLRVSDEDLQRLVKTLNGVEGAVCECVEAAPLEPVLLDLDSDYDEGDPPPLVRRSSFGPSAEKSNDDSRRRFLKKTVTAGALAFVGPMFLASAWDEPAFAAEYHYTEKAGVTMSDDVEKMAQDVSEEYNKATGKDIVVTDGTRLPEDQASAMYNKMKKKEDLEKLYSNKDAVKEIEAAYNDGVEAKETPDQIKADMANVVQDQIDEGTYISKHLKGGAFDVRSKDMTAKQLAAFKKAAADKGYKVITEGDHLHVQKK